MSATEEERDTLKQDLEGSDLGKDEVIKKAWETRDTAVKRKNASEVELARERIAVMQVNILESFFTFPPPLFRRRRRHSRNLERH